MTEGYASQDDLRRRSWIELEIDEPRLIVLTPSRAAVWTVDDVLEEWRQQRQRRTALEFVGVTHKVALELAESLSETRRRAAIEKSEGIDRPAATVELEDGRSASWEATMCFADETTRHGRHNLHGIVDPRRQPAIIAHDPCNDEPEYIDELKEVSQLAPLQVFVSDSNENEAGRAPVLVA